jgi:hypothetical protein
MIDAENMMRERDLQLAHELRERREAAEAQEAEIIRLWNQATDDERQGFMRTYRDVSVAARELARSRRDRDAGFVSSPPWSAARWREAISQRGR